MISESVSTRLLIRPSFVNRLAHLHFQKCLFHPRWSSTRKGLFLLEGSQLEEESVLGAEDEFWHFDWKSLFVETQLEVLENHRNASLQLVHCKVLTDAVPV